MHHHVILCIRRLTPGNQPGPDMIWYDRSLTCQRPYSRNARSQARFKQRVVADAEAFGIRRSPKRHEPSGALCSRVRRSMRPTSCRGAGALCMGFDSIEQVCKVPMARGSRTRTIFWMEFQNNYKDNHLPLQALATQKPSCLICWACKLSSMLRSTRLPLCVYSSVRTLTGQSKRWHSMPVGLHSV